MHTQGDPSITPFLLFAGKAEEAMNLYISVFRHAEVEEIRRYGADGAGAEGSVEMATFSLNGQRLMCTDSTVEMEFSFTPAISLFVTCGDVEELDRYLDALSKDGKILMPPDSYGFSTRFAWLEDRFGISWQLNLP